MNIELVGRLAWESVLKRLLSQMESLFDYCLIDCPPSLGLITQNALIASRYAIIPVEAEFFSFQGIQSIVGALSEVK
jgi:chromosome partitioning protein